MRARAELLVWGLVAGLAMGSSLPTVIAACQENRDPAAAPAKPPAPRSEAIKTAVIRALPLLKKASAVEYPKHRACFSCHNQAVPAVALALARQRGFAIDEETLHAIAEHTEADLNSELAAYQKGDGQPGGVPRAGYALWALEVTGWPHDETTAAVAHYLAVSQRARGAWSTQSKRAPSEASEFTATALALRGIRAFGEPASPKDTQQGPTPKPHKAGTPRPGRAAALRWLETTAPNDTEDRVFRLWGLKSAGAAPEALVAAVSDLVRTQRSDGGWSQLDPPAKPGNATSENANAGAHPAAHESDAYATGSALVALHLAGGVATDRPTYRRGLEFLIKAQGSDGSWHVKTRSRPFQAYFESGFPHGPDQFISAAASAWAVAALSLACPGPHHEAN
jgi:Squalene-hopene cyclase C-terminal domain